MQDQNKDVQVSLKFSNFQMHQFRKKVLSNDCITRLINKVFPHQKQQAEKQNFKRQSLYFNHKISIDIKGMISSSSNL